MEKATLGTLRGLCAVLVKFLGQDYSNVVAHAANLTADQLLSYKIGYGILTPILMLPGGFVAWISDEKKRIKIVALAIAAPAMITTWSGGHSALSDRPSNKSQYSSYNYLISTAYAQSFQESTGSTIEDKIKFVNPDVISPGDAFEKIKNGIEIFFWYGKLPQSCWVVVGSFKDKKLAQ